MRADGRYFGGGAWPRDGVIVVDTKTGEVFEPDSSPNTGPARGEFDPDGNYWDCCRARTLRRSRSEEHTSELQSPDHLVSPLLPEKKTLNTPSSVAAYS